MLLLLLVPALLAAEAQPHAQAWRTVAPGAVHMHLDAGDADLLRVDLGRYQADVLVPGPGHPLTAAAARRTHRAALAVNGGFFDGRGRSLGLRITGGKVVVPKRANVDWGVLLVRDGQASIVHSREYVADTRTEAAIQVGPRILVGGHPTPLKPQIARRTTIALDETGRSLTVVVTRVPIDAAALADALARLGFTDAIMLDGGPSTQLSASLGAFELEIPGGYAVPDLLLLRERGGQRR
jgi:uncharacterized protein YigE (DUF2233 family)